MDSRFWMIVWLCSLLTSCATLSSLDPFDDKEDVLVTDVSIKVAKDRAKDELGSKKQTHKHPHQRKKSPAKAEQGTPSPSSSARMPLAELPANHQGQNHSGSVRLPPRLSQNLPAEPDDSPFTLGTGLFDPAQGPDICDLSFKHCQDEELVATTCEIDPVILAANRQPLMAWGASRCSAMRLVTAEICRQGYQGVMAQHIVCAPDNKQATCPPAAIICAPDEREMVCMARSYLGAKLPVSQYPKVWGKSECQTRQKLRQFACALKLDPSRLGDIGCELDYTEGECPIQKDQYCTGDEAREFFVCEAKTYGGITLEVPLVTYGESRCEAEAALMDMACQYSDSDNRLRPSLLENINCYSKLEPK